MINYNHIKVRGNLVRIEVKIDGKFVGEIKQDALADIPASLEHLGPGWAYYPGNNGRGGIYKGRSMPTVDAVKKSLETNTEEDQTPPEPDFANMEFPDKVGAGFYKNLLNHKIDKVAYRERDVEIGIQFSADHRKWLLEQGVPKQYVDKVISASYDDGHSGGYSEVVNCSYKFIEIFSK